MGVSTNAILFYGYVWTEEEDLLLLRDDEEWTDRVLLRRGETNPWRAYPQEIERIENYQQRQLAGDNWCAEHRAELDAWYAKKAAVEKEFGVELDMHCSGDCPMPYLSAKTICARRGDPEKITDLAVKPEWAERLKKFMEELHIKKPKGGIGWWLVSYWC
jgi:hypothetical protein